MAGAHLRGMSPGGMTDSRKVSYMRFSSSTSFRLKSAPTLTAAARAAQGLIYSHIKAHFNTLAEH